MQNLCPLCLKNGVRKKVKLLQINLQEAVWVCEDGKCTWPFGHEDFTLCTRAVGKSWSCYWDDNTPTMLKTKDNIATSMKPALLSTPISLHPNILNVSVNNTDKYSLNSTNNVRTSFNELQTKTELSDLCIRPPADSNILSHIDDKEQCNKDNFISNDELIIPEKTLNNNSSKLIKNNTKQVILTTECTNSLSKHTKDKDSIPIQNVKNVSTVRGIPKITSIEKTNIDISNVKIGNQISLLDDLNKKMIFPNKTKNIVESMSLSEIEILSDSESTESDNIISKSNLNITKVEIDGLPPITLSFETPVCITKPETVVSNTQWTHGRNSAKPNITETRRISKRNITSGKQYEKFSFTAIKKKVEKNDSVHTCSNNNSSHTKAKSEIEQVENGLKDNITKKENDQNINVYNTVSFNNNSKQTGPNVNSNICTLSQLDNCTSFSNQDVSSDTLNTSMNLDNVLEDLLNNDYNVPEEINDEWINSLLS